MVHAVRMTGWSLLPLGVLLAGVGVAGMSPVSQQPRVVTLSTVSCATCRILAESVAYVGHPLDTISVAMTTIPARDSRGRFYAISSAFRQAYAFDSRGRLTHAFGTAGEGPGEFSSAVREIHVGSGDTLYFLERGKVNVFSPDYKVARQLPIASTAVGRRSAAVMKDGSIVRLTGLNEFTLFRRDGIRSPAGAVRLQVADTNTCPACGVRHLANGNDGNSVWSMSSREYSFDQHDPSGRPLAHFARVVSWFPRFVSPSPGRPPDLLDPIRAATVLGMQQTSDGLVWTFIRAPDADFPFPAGVTSQTLSGTDNGYSFLMRHLATYVEVFDPVRGQLLASRKIKGVVFPMRDGFAADAMRDSVSGVAFKILRLSLTR